MNYLRFFPQQLESVLNGEGVQRQLHEVADDIARLVRSDLRQQPGVSVYVRSGESRRGAFAQTVMRDEEHVAGAIAIEYGTRGAGPKAPLRTALRQVR